LQCPSGFLKIPIYSKDWALVILLVFYFTTFGFALARWFAMRQQRRSDEQVYPMRENQRYESDRYITTPRLTSGSIDGFSSLSRRNRNWFET